jgi:hypothetical protein
VTDDAGCPGDSEGRRDTLCLEVKVVEESDGYVLNYNAYPFETWLDPNWSGPAVMRMLIDHYRNDPWVPTQEELDVMGRDRNQSPCNDGLPYVDPLGMKLTLNDPDILHNNIHGRSANYGIGNFNADDLEGVLHYICWYQYAGPGAAPTGGDYSHWMAIRGIHTSEDPHTAGGEYDIYGFWINDPAPGGIGENSYKTIEQWTGDPCYYQNLIGVRDCDDYYERYVAVCEPPDQPDAKVRLIPSPARFNRPITTMEKAVMVDALGEQMLVEGLEDEDALDVVKAAIDGVTEQLIPYDSQFAEIFAKTVAGEPLPVNDGNGNYYLVPFNLPTVKPGEAIEIQKLNEEDLEVLQVIEGKVVAENIPIEKIKVNKKNTLVVVLVDAEEGSFKETSWVDDPMKYLPVSKEEALKLVLADVGTSETKPIIELVNIDNSPYYPAWKITIDKKVFYVSQDGTVSM